jgi:hypothetical protein
MTQAVNARRDGDTFQARVFWLKAAALLDDQGSVIRVGFESGPRGFDDVWVQYDRARPPLDHRGNPLDIERLQCKWHTGLGTYSHVDLTLPSFINASTTSLLQRAHAAFQADRAGGVNSRVKLVTNHRVDPGDTLHALIRSRSNTLKIDDLFAGKTDRSATGKVRKLWRDHLGIDDDELMKLCGVLGFSHTPESLEELRQMVDVTLKAHGLKTSGVQGSASIYDDIVFQWGSQGRLEFDRKSFREACEREGMLAGQSKTHVIYGVKSFEHAFDRLEDRCTKVLDLVPEFDERFIRNPAAWQSGLLPALRTFLHEAATFGETRLRLVLDAHATLAFAAGSVLNTKSGRLVEIEQRAPDRKVWAPDDAVVFRDWPDWEIAVHELEREGSGIAIAIGLSRDVAVKVSEYVASNLPGLRKLVVAKPQGGASQRAVLGGAHADWLADRLVARVSTERDLARDDLHLFIAAPNAFTFYLGRHIHTLKPVTLYEFDFESQRDGSYQASLTIGK